VGATPLHTQAVWAAQLQNPFLTSLLHLLAMKQGAGCCMVGPRVMIVAQSLTNAFHVMQQAGLTVVKPV
jgi:hypothetical protein